MAAVTEARGEGCFQRAFRWDSARGASRELGHGHARLGLAREARWRALHGGAMKGGGGGRVPAKRWCGSVN